MGQRSVLILWACVFGVAGACSALRRGKELRVRIPSGIVLIDDKQKTLVDRIQSLRPGTTKTQVSLSFGKPTSDLGSTWVYVLAAEAGGIERVLVAKFHFNGGVLEEVSVESRRPPASPSSPATE